MSGKLHMPSAKSDIAIGYNIHSTKRLEDPLILARTAMLRSEILV